MILYDEKSLQLTFQNNHGDIEHLGIIHVVWRLCVALHHSDLYPVCAHVVGERPIFGCLICRKWYENQKLLSPSPIDIFLCIFCRFIWWRFLFTHVKHFIVFQWNYTMSSTMCNDLINVKPYWGCCLWILIICFLVSKIDTWTFVIALQYTFLVCTL